MDLVGPDGTLYGDASDKVIALDSSGRVRWRYPFLETGPMAVLPDGSLAAIGFTYTSFGPSGNSAGAAAVSLSSTGLSRWKVQPFGLTKGATPLVAATGDFYAPIVGPHDGSPSQHFIGLDMIASDGTIRERIQPGDSTFGAAVAPDGSIYAVTANALTAFDVSGHRLWRRHLSSACCALNPLVGRGGVVYVSDSAGNILSFNLSGHLRWRAREHDGSLTLAEQPDGTILAAGSHWLAAVSRSGKTIWRLRLEHRTPGSYARPPSLAVDASGAIYVGTERGQVLIVSRTGRPRSHFAADGTSTPGVILGPGGRLVVSGSNGMVRVYGRKKRAVNPIRRLRFRTLGECPKTSRRETESQVATRLCESTAMLVVIRRRWLHQPP